MSCWKKRRELVCQSTRVWLCERGLGEVTSSILSVSLPSLVRKHCSWQEWLSLHGLHYSKNTLTMICIFCYQFDPKQSKTFGYAYNPSSQSSMSEMSQYRICPFKYSADASISVGTKPEWLVIMKTAWGGSIFLYTVSAARQKHFKKASLLASP